MKISLVQQRITWGKKSENLALFSAEMAKLAGKTDVVLLPEMFATGFCVNNLQLAETVDGEIVTTVKKWAKAGNFAVVGTFMATDGEKFYNRAFFCQPNGAIFFADKHHLFFGDEQNFFTAGEKRLDVTFRGVKFRILICFELRFPVWCRNLGGDDYDVLVFVANWPQIRVAVWDLLLRARALENQACVCGVNVVGTDLYDIYHNGHSVMIDAVGNEIITFAESEIATKTAEFDLEKQNRGRKRHPIGKISDKFCFERKEC